MLRCPSPSLAALPLARLGSIPGRVRRRRKACEVVGTLPGGMTEREIRANERQKRKLSDREERRPVFCFGCNGVDVLRARCESDKITVVNPLPLPGNGVGPVRRRRDRRGAVEGAPVGPW